MNFLCQYIVLDMYFCFFLWGRGGIKKYNVNPCLQIRRMERHGTSHWGRDQLVAEGIC